MEPIRNPRVARSQKQVFYNFTRRYGEQIVLRKVLLSDVDYATGSPTRTYTSVTIRNAVYVPPTVARNVTYTPAMMQAVRSAAWQGGAGQDIEHVAFLICERDVRAWGDLDATQFITWRGSDYEVTDAQHFDGGVVATCKVAKGSRT